MSIFDKVMSIPEYAAMKMAEAQHAEGVTMRMNHRTFKTEYIRPDGTLVPDYNDFYYACLIATNEQQVIDE